MVVDACDHHSGVRPAGSTWMGWCLLAFLAGFSLPGGALEKAPAANAARRPNIVFILIDDAGYSDFGSYGGEISTPNIDSLARGGVRFTNFHTASTCEASRAMLYSGVDSHQAGAGTLRVVVADNQRNAPGYEGYLNERSHSVGQLMHDAGYATYFAGKWNLGEGVARSPGARGFDRYIGLEQTGADNFEAKVYAPLNRNAVWWEDGKPAVLPGNFFSTRHYFDKIIQFIDEGRKQRKPFFAVVATQAVHSPLQAPAEDIAKYLGRYDAGWEAVRAARYRRQVEMGLVPPGLTLPRQASTSLWSQADAGIRREYAKKMAVYAGMLDNADQHLGRLRAHLQSIGELDNTVFIVMSDNGADAYELNKLNLPFRLWYLANKKLGYDTLGDRGSYVHYGQNWAQVSNTPFSDFKGTSQEGGMRVPFIINWPGRIKPAIARQFAFATDFLPTVLDIAGIPLPGPIYDAKRLHQPQGASLLPLAEGRAETVHPDNQAIGFEGTGGFAVFKGDYKLQGGVFGGAGHARLFNIVSDPTESHDLARAEPDRFSAMRQDLQRYFKANGVVPPPANYNPLWQVLVNNWPTLVRQVGVVLAPIGVGLILVLWLVARLIRRRLQRHALTGHKAA